MIPMEEIKDCPKCGTGVFHHHKCAKTRAGWEVIAVPYCNNCDWKVTLIK